MVLECVVDPPKLQNCQNPLVIKSKIADDGAKIVHKYVNCNNSAADCLFNVAEIWHMGALWVCRGCGGLVHYGPRNES